MESIEKQIKNLEKRARGLDKDAIKLLADANTIKTNLEKFIPARNSGVDSAPFNLLTSKPVIYADKLGAPDYPQQNPSFAAFKEFPVTSSNLRSNSFASELKCSGVWITNVT